MSVSHSEATVAPPSRAMTLQGRFTPPGDKSICHRLALVSVLASGEMRVRGFSPGRDCARSLEAVRQLGVTAEGGPDRMVLRGASGRINSGAFIDCGNSGTTMRLLMGILAGRQGWYLLDGDASLRQRPMERVAGPLRAMGAGVECFEGRPPVRIIGRPLTGATHRLPVASAQLKSALLLAGVQASSITRVIEPGPSRDHTERLLTRCGAQIWPEDDTWVIEPSELTLPEEFMVPGDISSAVFLLCGAALIPGGDVTAERVLLNPTRLGWLEVLRRMQARVEVETLGADPEPWGNVRVCHSPDLQAVEVRAEEIPSLVDEVPILALVATQAQGTTVFRGVGELRVKETDRLAAVISELSKLGASLEANDDDLLIEGPTPLRAGARDLDSHDDHRMAMTLRIAGMVAGHEVEIRGEECAAISFPGFETTLEELRR